MFDKLKREAITPGARKVVTFLLGDRGAAMIEATISILLLLLVTFGIIQFGLILFVENSMQDAVRQAVRETSVGSSVLENSAQVSGTRPLCTTPSSIVTVADFDNDGITDNTSVTPAERIACDGVGDVPGTFYVVGYLTGDEVTIELEVNLNSILLVNILSLISGSSLIVSETMTLEQ
jgi:hypothetical protein